MMVYILNLGLIICAIIIVILIGLLIFTSSFSIDYDALCVETFGEGFRFGPAWGDPDYCINDSEAYPVIYSNNKIIKVVE